MKNRFIGLLGEVKRPCMDQLIKWLTDKSDFFTAPASTKYHGAKGGAGCWNIRWQYMTS